MINILFINFYLLSNLFSIYIIYKFFKIFFSNRIYNIKLEIFVYGIYFLSTSIVYLVFNQPLLTLITNLVSLFFITLLYESNIKNKIIAVGLVYIVSLLAESCIVLIGFFYNWNYLETASIIISRIILLVIVQLLNTNKFLKNDILIPKIQWISIIIFPIGSIIIFKVSTYNLTLFSSFICLLVLLMFNVLIFYVFDRLNKEYIVNLKNKLKVQEKTIEAEMFYREKNIYQQQLHIINSTNDKLRSLQHDIKGHHYVLKILLMKNKIDEAEKYIDRMFPTILEEMYIDTGNVTITSILNYYIGKAKKLEIDFKYELKIPDEINIDSFDLSTILINLLQNAFEALEKCESDKTINIKMKYDKNILYLMIENKYNGLLLKDDSKFITMKNDKKLHGYGIQNVLKSVQRYDGEIEFLHTKDLFKVFIMLYNKAI